MEELQQNKLEESLKWKDVRKDQSKIIQTKNVQAKPCASSPLGDKKRVGELGGGKWHVQSRRSMAGL